MYETLKRYDGTLILAWKPSLNVSRIAGKKIRTIKSISRKIRFQRMWKNFLFLKSEHLVVVISQQKVEERDILINFHFSPYCVCKEFSKISHDVTAWLVQSPHFRSPSFTRCNHIRPGCWAKRGGMSWFI